MLLLRIFPLLLFLNLLATRANAQCGQTYISKLKTDDSRQTCTITLARIVPNVTYEVWVQEVNPTMPTGPQPPARLATYNSGGTSLTVLNLDANKYYCFYVQYTCSSVTYMTNRVCNLVLENTPLSSEEMLLNWNRLIEPSSVSDSKSIETVGVSSLPVFNQNTTQQVIRNVSCKNVSNIYLRSKYSQSLSSSASLVQVEIVSNSIKIDPAGSKPPSPDYPLFTGFNNAFGNSVEIRIGALNLAKKEFAFYRAPAGSSNFEKAGTISGNVLSFIDRNVDMTKAYCYKYTYTDNCDRESELSPPYCTPSVQGQANEVLNWSAPGLPMIVNGTERVDIEVFNGVEGTILQSGAVGTSSSTAISQGKAAYPSASLIDYRINWSGIVQILDIQTGEYVNQFVILNSNVYKYAKPAEFSIPNAFSPNGDSLNDTFLPRFDGISAWDFRIFNRWGIEVFGTTDLNSTGWDGSYNGSLAPEGVYTYKISTTSQAGVGNVKTGAFTLIR